MYMKRMGSENDKTRQGIWNETERYFDNQNQGLKSLKRQKSPAKSFARADELKRQFTYTLKPSKCSSTDIPKCKTTNSDSTETQGPQETSVELDNLRPQQKTKFFTDIGIENIFANSECFKLKTGNAASMSFCSGENGENRWTIDTKSTASRRTTSLTSSKAKDMCTSVTEELVKPKKSSAVKKCEVMMQADELKSLTENVDTIIKEMKILNRDFGLVRMDLKTIEKLLRLEKQVTGKSKSKKEGLQSEADEINSKLGKFSEEVEKAAQELREFIENNRTLLIESEEFPEYPDFDKIINNLHRLSETAYQPKIIQTSKGAKFEVPRELPISLYSDGILLRNNDFRKYSDVRASLFLRDIEDGFFPSELWPEFPYGVPFQVTDRRCEMFNDGNPECLNRFPGNGRRLGSEFDGKPSSMVYLEPAKMERANVETSGCGEPDRKKSMSFNVQEHYKNSLRGKGISRNINDGSEDTNGSIRGDVIPKLMSLKVRLGIGEGFLQLNIMSNEKMSRFQDTLFRKLCERYHDEYVKNINSNNDSKYNETVPDFEIHIYGQKPFRLSENLNLYPSECGIVDNCVVNITEI